MNQHLAISRDDLGPYLHTALRKTCDSKPTSLLYNVIHLCPDDDWSGFLDRLWEGLNDHPQAHPGGDLLTVLRIAAADFGTAGRNALKLSIDLLSDADAAAMLSWIWKKEPGP